MCSIIGYIGHRLTAESVKPYFDPSPVGRI